MNRELRKLKKELLKLNEISKEYQLAKALRVAFKSVSNKNNVIDDEMSIKEAYEILGWGDGKI